MPIYEYIGVGGSCCSQCAERFEVVEPITAAPLAACPACSGPVARVLSAPAIHGAGSSGETLSNKNLADKGFTKYVKAGGGYYEKAAGSGPDVIRR